ncbi:hypothetical protein [Parendozoicomonas haliclonae]|uniref:Archaeal holliday junction resolvase (Hjc) n=1 Tax=Parendozoicomonas haliclonae TaxID=1960125 RepID=A0A1X7AEU2_9GAMM|nr:hypothetical protein [Parendozoicomonas haliclonae]SMA33648.1 hypothetical protein EHSB41UT_00311 [Parendozoicomonas haliclonae]
MNEHSYVDSLKGKLKRQVSLIWKIKDDYQGGVPDIFIEGSQSDAFIEAKYIKSLPKREKTLIDLTNSKYLSPLQQKWLKRRFQTRGDAFVIVGHPGGTALFRGLEWQTPLTREEFEKKTVPTKEAVQILLKFVNG